MTRQTDILARLPANARVAVIRLRSLGDSVLSTPALELLKRARPDCAIGVCIEERFADVYLDSPHVTRILEPAVRAIRAFGPELVLNLHGGSRSARLTLLSGAKYRAGFDIFRPSWIYNTPIPTAQQTLGVARRVHTAEHAASAVFYLGAPLSEVPRASLYPPEGRSPAAPAGNYAVIHAGAATEEKTWPARSFREVADWLRQSLGLETVVIGGPAEDLSGFSGLHISQGSPLRETARLIRDACLFLGNDSGPAHIAAAFGVPSVVIFGPSDSDIWAPWKTRSRVIKAEGPIDSIAAAEVMRAVEAL